MKNLIFAFLLVSSATTFAQDMDEEAILAQPVMGGEAVGTETVVPDATPAISDDEVVAVGAPRVIETEMIDVDGHLSRPQKITDPELETIHAEIKKQKKEVVLNKAKAQKYQELSKSVEKLAETTEVYLEEKNETKKQIAEYNLMVKCRSTNSTAEECSKWNRKR